MSIFTGQYSLPWHLKWLQATGLRAFVNLNETFQASQQHCCWVARQISQWYKNLISKLTTSRQSKALTYDLWISRGSDCGHSLYWLALEVTYQVSHLQSIEWIWVGYVSSLYEDSGARSRLHNSVVNSMYCLLMTCQWCHETSSVS